MQANRKDQLLQQKVVNQQQILGLQRIHSLPNFMNNRVAESAIGTVATNGVNVSASGITTTASSTPPSHTTTKPTSLRVWLSTTGKQSSATVKTSQDGGSSTVFLPSGFDMTKLYPQLSKLGLVKTNGNITTTSSNLSNAAGSRILVSTVQSSEHLTNAVSTTNPSTTTQQVTGNTAVPANYITIPSNSLNNNTIITNTGKTGRQQQYINLSSLSNANVVTNINLNKTNLVMSNGNISSVSCPVRGTVTSTSPLKTCTGVTSSSPSVSVAAPPSSTFLPARSTNGNSVLQMTTAAGNNTNNFFNVVKVSTATSLANNKYNVASNRILSNCSNNTGILTTSSSPTSFKMLPCSKVATSVSPLQVSSANTVLNSVSTKETDSLRQRTVSVQSKQSSENYDLIVSSSNNSLCGALIDSNYIINDVRNKPLSQSNTSVGHCRAFMYSPRDVLSGSEGAVRDVYVQRSADSNTPTAAALVTSAASNNTKSVSCAASQKSVKEAELNAQQKQLQLQRQLQQIHGGLSRAVAPASVISGSSRNPSVVLGTGGVGVVKQIRLSQQQMASLLAQSSTSSTLSLVSKAFTTCSPSSPSGNYLVHTGAPLRLSTTSAANGEVPVVGIRGPTAHSGVKRKASPSTVRSIKSLRVSPSILTPLSCPFNVSSSTAVGITGDRDGHAHSDQVACKQGAVVEEKSLLPSCKVSSPTLSPHAPESPALRRHREQKNKRKLVDKNILTPVKDFTASESKRLRIAPSNSSTNLPKIKGNICDTPNNMESSSPARSNSISLKTYNISDSLSNINLSHQLHSSNSSIDGEPNDYSSQVLTNDKVSSILKDITVPDKSDGSSNSILKGITKLNDEPSISSILKDHSAHPNRAILINPSLSRRVSFSPETVDRNLSPNRRNKSDSAAAVNSSLLHRALNSPMVSHSGKIPVKVTEKRNYSRKSKLASMQKPPNISEDHTVTTSGGRNAVQQHWSTMQTSIKSEPADHQEDRFTNKQCDNGFYNDSMTINNHHPSPPSLPKVSPAGEGLHATFSGALRYSRILVHPHEVAPLVKNKTRWPVPVLKLHNLLMKKAQSVQDFFPAGVDL